MRKPRRSAKRKIKQPTSLSPPNPQRNEILSKSKIDPSGIKIDFKTRTQETAWQLAAHVDILFLLGAAGSGKSHLATAIALDAVATGQAENIVLTRPIVEAGENLGFLPGEVGNKVSEYLAPIRDIMDDIVGRDGRNEIMSKHVKMVPLAYSQGRTFKNAVCIFDEAQNATYAQLKTYLSRLGEGSKMVLTADPSQLYIDESGFLEVVDKLREMREVGIVRFEHIDVVRHKTVAKVLKRLD